MNTVGHLLVEELQLQKSRRREGASAGPTQNNIASGRSAPAPVTSIFNPRLRRRFCKLEVASSEAGALRDISREKDH